MAVSNWINRRRLLRRSFATIAEGNEEKDEAVLDPDKDDKENTLRILSNLCRQEGLTDGQKISYLKGLNKIIDESRKNNVSFFMKNEHIFRCLKTCLTSKSSGVRSAAYRVFRNILDTQEDVAVLNDLQIPKLIARSVDMGAIYEDERIQALRFIVKILALNPEQFYVGMIRSLIALANGLGEIQDKMASSSLVILCYMCVLNPELVIECYGHYALLKCSLEVTDPRLNEDMLICLMYLLNKRDLRERANIHLDYVISNYTEWEKKRPENEPKPPFKINEMSVLTILRSWTGLYHFCQPNIAGIKVIVDVLYLQRDDLRKAILDLLCQVFGIDRKVSTEDLSEAIEIIDPSKYHESWNINSGFIVAEGKDIIPHKNLYRPNLTEIQTALVLQAFLECGLLPALVEIVVSPDPVLSVQAVVVLGAILHLSHKLIPTEINHLGRGLPTLAEYTSSSLPDQRFQAIAAISALSKINEVLKTKPTPKSLFLKQLVFYSTSCKNDGVQCERYNVDENEDSEDIFEEMNATHNANIAPEPQAYEWQDKFNFYFLQLEFERKSTRGELTQIDHYINKSNVLWFSDYRDWDWNRIEYTLKNPDEPLTQLQEAYHRKYIKKLIYFYKPSSRRFSEIEYNHNKTENDIITTTAFYLIDFLLQSDDGGKDKFLDEFLYDLSQLLVEVVSNESLYTIFFNPRHMVNTMCQHYFLMIGRLSSTEKGIEALNKRDLLKICSDIVCPCRHEYYAKLIVSSLNYNVPSRTRHILSKAVCSPMESVRNYATELLLILGRLDVKNFSEWGTDLLISLLYSEDNDIAVTSINILQELCYDELYLKSLLEAKPSVLHLIDKGDLLLVRFLSTPEGFAFLSDANYIEAELLKWEREYNIRYVQLIEDELNNALTMHDLRDYEKIFKRLTYNGYKYDDVFIPFHLYGELAKHEKGFESLVRNGEIFKMAQNLRKYSCDSNPDILQLKSSLYGLSNMSTSKLGFEFLDKENVFQAVVELAYSCPVLSIRAAASYCLCLISTTIPGANAIEKYGWYTVRRNRSEEWPDMIVSFSILDEIRQSKMEAIESASVPVASPPPDEDLIDFDRACDPYDISLSPSPEKTLTLAERLLKKFKSSKREGSIDSQFLEKEGDIFTSSNLNFFEGREGTSQDESDTHVKKKNSSDNASVDGSSEGALKTRFWNAVSFKKLRSLYNNRRKNDAVSDSKAQSLEEINPQAETALNLSSFSSSQLDLGSNQEEKFVLSYKGLSLPKSLSMIFTNTSTSDSDLNNQETLPNQDEEEVLPNNLAETEVKNIGSEQDSFDFTIHGTIDDGASSQELYHDSETCIGCCTKLWRSFETSYPYEGDHLDGAGSSNNDTENAVQMPPSGSENTPAEDEGPSAGAAAGSIRSDSEISKETTSISEQRNVHRTIVKQIMKQIRRMFNPVMCKAAKEELSQMRRRYPRIFKDVCVYSNVCHLLSASSCRITSRFFIQNLFNDVQYPMVFEDAAKALQEYIPEDTSSIEDILPFILRPHSSSQRNVLPLKLYKPRRIRTVSAHPARAPKINPFDDVPATDFTFCGNPTSDSNVSEEDVEKTLV